MGQSWAFIVAAITTFIAVPLVRQRLRRRNLIDVPNERSSHSVPTPRGAGIACLLGLFVGGLVLAATGHTVPWPVAIIVLVLALVGLVDDHAGLSPRLRLLVQGVAGLVFGLATGSLWTALVAAIVVIVVTNAVNFMDGINGITGATVLAWGICMVVLGVQRNQPELTALGGLGFATALGYLPFNISGSIFLGDVGGYAYGALIATGSVIAGVSGIPAYLILAPLLPYLVDVGVTLLRRANRRESITAAHREHLYQLLVSRRGLAHPVVAGAYGATSMLAFATVLRWGPRPALILAAAATAGCLFTANALWRSTERATAR